QAHAQGIRRQPVAFRSAAARNRGNAQARRRAPLSAQAPARMGPQVKLLLDSVILIDHFNGIAAATSYLSRHHPDAAISVITRAEVLTGFERRASKKAADFLDC